MIMENGGTGKTLYNEVIQVPFLIYLPDGGIEEKRVGSKVSMLDILPTLAEFVGLPPDENHMGVSLVSFIDKK